jgi:hypothetical protein
LEQGRDLRQSRHCRRKPGVLASGGVDIPELSDDEKDTVVRVLLANIAAIVPTPRRIVALTTSDAAIAFMISRSRRVRRSCVRLAIDRSDTTFVAS